ncbi:MAG: alpha/beta hydrolase [Chloroflexota bacterium]
MSCIVTQQGILHYESIGRGQPIILLHGWINSWAVWRDSMIALSDSPVVNGTGSRRVFALDFWGFGDSALPRSYDETPFQINSYVEMVHEFMDNLGIARAPLAGHSMGGTVALQFALDYPERVEKVVVVGSPIVGSSLNPFLKLAGYGWIASMVWRFPVIRSTIMRILLAGDSKRVQQMIFRDVERTSLDSFFRSIGDLRDTDLRQEIGHLSPPALGIYGRRDNIVSPTNAQLLANGTGRAQVAMMERSRHFPMSDQPEDFVSTLIGFLRGNSGYKAQQDVISI